MTCFSPATLELLASVEASDIAAQLGTHYDQLVGWRESFVDYGDPKTISENRRARNNLAILRLGLAHRAEQMCVAADGLIIGGNPHGLALAARGHVEATAQLGFFCGRLAALAKGHIDFDAFNLQLAETLMGAGHSSFSGAPKPLNILTAIEKADRYLIKDMGWKGTDGMLADIYGWLSDYCHPNFLSSVSSYKLDKTTHHFNFLYDQPFDKRNSDLLTHFSLSAMVFSALFESLLASATVIDGE